jgi:hypothetical protein
MGASPALQSRRSAPIWFISFLISLWVLLIFAVLLMQWQGRT